MRGKRKSQTYKSTPHDKIIKWVPEKRDHDLMDRKNRHRGDRSDRREREAQGRHRRRGGPDARS